MPVLPIHDLQVPQDYRSSTVAEQGAAATAHERALDDSPVEGFICPDCRINFDAADALVAHFGFEHTNAGAGTDRGGAGGSTPSGVVGARGLDPQDFAGRGEGGRSIDGGGGGGESDDFSGNDVAAAGSLKDQLFGRRRDDEPGTGAMAGTSGGGRSGGGGGGGVIAEQQAFMAAQDDYLDSVGKAVAELGLLGRNIGASLEGQGDAIERVVVKTEESNDRAAFVTRKAARQAQSSKPKKPTFVMSVALQARSMEMERRCCMTPFGFLGGLCLLWRRLRREARQNERGRSLKVASIRMSSVAYVGYLGLFSLSERSAVMFLGLMYFALFPTALSLLAIYTRRLPRRSFTGGFDGSLSDRYW